jgi:hypothetical protein
LGVPAAARIEIPGGFPYTYLVKKSMNKNFKAVLFDVDETLFDRMLAQKAVLALIVQQLPQVFSGYAPERVLAAFLKSDQIYTDLFNNGAPSEGSRDRRSKLFLQLLGIDEKYTAKITELYLRDYPGVKAHVDGAIPVIKELISEISARRGLQRLHRCAVPQTGSYGVAGFIFLHCPVGGIRHPKARPPDFSSGRIVAAYAAARVFICRGFLYQ